MTKAKDPKPPRPRRTGPATKTNPTTGGFQISDELWEVLEPLIPQRMNTHRFGGGRPGFSTAPAPTASSMYCAPAASGKRWTPQASAPGPPPTCAFSSGSPQEYSWSYGGRD